MPVNYVSVEEGMADDGLRMVVVSGVPSPWGEAAKGIFHIKGLEWRAVRLAYDDDDLKKWTRRNLSGPIAFYGDDPPRSGWAEILMLAERLAPTPSLLPSDPLERALMVGLSHEILGEEGLLWLRRLQAVDWGLNGQEGGFAPPVAKYLSQKYGYTEGRGDEISIRITALLTLLSDRLEAQQAAGSAFYFGDQLSALDIYSAAAMALFAPLPDKDCPLPPPVRAAFETTDDATRAALKPILLTHRDKMYGEFLETPLCL